jgi:hypothetical protein
VQILSLNLAVKIIITEFPRLNIGLKNKMESKYVA